MMDAAEPAAPHHPSVEMIGIRHKNQGGYEGIGRTEEEGPRAGEGSEKEERFDTGLYS